MPSPLIESIYVFAVVTVFLGGLWMVVRRLIGTRKGVRSSAIRGASQPSLFLENAPDAAEQTPRRRPSFVPPPSPRDDREYFQAVHDARENDLPPPLPPSVRERDEW
jgi:hypothetical protein